MGLPPVVECLSVRLAELGWVRDLLVAGSLATGDYVAGVSDIDLVAVIGGGVDGTREATLAQLHRDLDRGSSSRSRLGCVYIEEERLADPLARHPAWAHGRLVYRALSGITRAELVRNGFAVYGRAPVSLLPAMSDEDVRAAAHAELCGYWAWAARRPWMWLDPTIADLSLTSMARGRYSMQTGCLLSKTAAIDRVQAPDWLIDDLRARRQGKSRRSPHVRAAWLSWRDARRTVASCRRTSAT